MFSLKEFNDFFGITDQGSTGTICFLYGGTHWKIKNYLQIKHLLSSAVCSQFRLTFELITCDEWKL